MAMFGQSELYTRNIGPTAVGVFEYMVKSHEMDSLGDCVCNSGGHSITYYKQYF